MITTIILKIKEFKVLLAGLGSSFAFLNLDNEQIEKISMIAILLALAWIIHLLKREKTERAISILKVRVESISGDLKNSDSISDLDFLVITELIDEQERLKINSHTQQQLQQLLKKPVK